MQIRPTPPTIPADLREQYGEPEYVFGPNMRFRIASVLLGVILFLLGVTFLSFGVVEMVGRVGPRGSEGVLVLLGGGLILIGVVAVVFSRSVPLDWVFVCPGGLIRTRSSNWEAVGWAHVSRFEDASVSSGTLTVQQCRVITSTGAEWGFLANLVAEYEKLSAILRRKVEERSILSIPHNGPFGN